MENLNNLPSVAGSVDFTLLDPRASLKDIEKLCDIAYKNQYYAVCVNPCNIHYAKGYIDKNFNGELKVVAVVGFPLGANTTEIKLMEAKAAIADGADELDMVINIGRAVSGDYAYIKNEFVKIRRATKGRVLKAIIETCYLTENDMLALLKLAIKCKFDFVKTSTGFGTAGASSANVKLLSEAARGRIKIKASGGIRSRQDAINLLGSGADRIGTSHVI